MPKPKALTPAEARKTFAHRFGPTVDKLRQLSTGFGLRPYRVFLTWVRWTGDERGEGNEVMVKRVEILPTPRVQNLDAISMTFMHAGTLDEGSLRVDRISSQLTEDLLRGKMAPLEHEDRIPEPYDFFYEVVEDGRGDDPPKRTRFRLYSTPYRRAGKIDWTVVLQPVDEPRTRDDRSRMSAPGQP